MTKKKKIHIIGGGLAGSEAAYFLLKRGYEVFLHERRPLSSDSAHHTEYFGELVCSNSLKSKRLDNACGLLKEEMRLLGSLMMEAASFSEVPAGNALAVDRDLFAQYMTKRLRSFPSFHVIREEVKELDFENPTILATGPLTSDSLLSFLKKTLGEEMCSFFDASAPIVKKESLDFSICYYKSRFEQGDDSYINAPFTKEQYFQFVRELVKAKTATLHEGDSSYFEGCLPLEVMAKRDIETLRHGPLKPFGLRKDENARPYAVMQMRQDDQLASLYNLVGFQTNLTYEEQRRVFRLIPGLEHAEFVRYGLMHRNAFLDSGKVLNEDLSLKKGKNIFIAGQLSGVEGYVESAASGIAVAISLATRLEKDCFSPFPIETMLGALLRYITFPRYTRLEPMNANWGLLGVNKNQREEAVKKSLKSLREYQEKYL